MSLVRQIRWTLILLVVLAFSSAFVISTRSLRQTLQQQLTVKNIDNANALALGLSQLSQDPVTLSLLVSAQFDTGHYRFIRLTTPAGEELASRTFEGQGPAVPDWFVRLVSLDIPPGVAQIQQGWKAFATLTLASHEQYAYETMWSAAQVLAAWFAAALLAAAALGTVAVQWITAPLRAMVEQARELSQRRFRTLVEPRSVELREVAQAMNQAVQSLQAMFTAEARQIDELKRRVSCDRTTGLPLRELFIGHLAQVLKDEQQARSGTLAVIHFNDLAGLNLKEGRPAVDALLGRVARALESLSGQAGQLNGSDLALLLPGETDAPAVARALRERMGQALEGRSGVLRMGIVTWADGDTVGTVLTRADEAVTRADNPEGWHVLERTQGDRPRVELGMQAWRQLIVSALAAPDALALQLYPLCSLDGQTVLQEEAFARLDVVRVWPPGAGPAPTQGLNAGEFIPMAARLGLGGSVDLKILECAVQRLLAGQAAGVAARVPIVINLGPDSLLRLEFRQGLRRLVQAHPAVVSSLAVEAPEAVVLAHPEAFQELSLTLQQLGVKVGVDFFGLRFDHTTRLETFGLSHIKLHPSLVAGLAQSAAQRQLIARLASTVASVGIAVYAQGVAAPEEIPVLGELGVVGVIGPAVRPPASRR